MSKIKVKNNAGTEVVYNNVDTVVLPTSDGGTEVFRKWDGNIRAHIHSVCVVGGILLRRNLIINNQNVKISCTVSAGENT